MVFSRSAHTFTDATGQRYRGFVCNFPASLAAQGKRKVCVWRRVGDPDAWIAGEMDKEASDG